MNDPPDPRRDAASDADDARPHPHLEALAEELAAHAATLRAERPDLPLVGLIAARPSPWFRKFEALIDEANDRPSRGPWAAAVLDREIVFEALVAEGGTDAWLFVQRCAEDPPGDALPIVIATREGYRLGWAEPPPPSPE